MNLTPELLKTIAFAHASFMFGISAVILYYYFRRIQRFGTMQRHILAVILSHMGLTGCTMISIDRGLYQPGEPWYWIVGASYLLTDVSLLALWKNQINKQRNEKNK